MRTPGGKSRSGIMSDLESSFGSPSVEDFPDVKSVPWQVSADEPGYYVNYGDAESIHNATLVGPLPPRLVIGADPQLSQQNLRFW